MQEKETIEANLERIIDATLRGDRAYWDYLYDDVPKMKNLPPQWEEVIIRASQRVEALTDEEFAFFCARVLVRMDSRWIGLSDLLTRVLRIRPGFQSLELAAVFLASRKDPPDAHFAGAVLDAYRSWWWGWKALNRVDTRIQRLVASCKRVPLQ